ncbi:hypothetical protein JYU34_016759 [Plutella xylostella]|uniref:Protein aurora borealis n=1 Tax=Plutella xylostella TaxID=51655 RepID=A0ABQ7Q3E2_PLUXY|nr:hypothetical protein JYU34_016759 [Plutella xylostella]
MTDESPKSNFKSTPPTNRKVRNPFDKVLIGKLHQPICSPGMCKIYKKQSNGLFRWDIDQACTLVPADIVPCNSQFEPSPDPALERIAEEATERFFSQESVMPSPIVSSKKVKPLQISYEASTSVHITSIVKEPVETRDVSAQTILTMPPELPPELAKVLQKYCTFTQEQNISGDYEITANGSLRRKLQFEWHSDAEHCDSELTDEEAPKPSYEPHAPVVFSPDLSRDVVSKGMKRTFGTPLSKPANGKPRNKILDVVDFGEPCFSPIQFQTPRRGLDSGASPSLASASISPVTKVGSSDEEKNNFTSPESEAMATCLDCIISDPESGSDKKGPCFCKSTPEKFLLKRSKSLKDSPVRSRKGSFSEKRSLSMSSLHRSRSVQKLDFSMDMSLDASMHSRSQDDCDISPLQAEEQTWSIIEESSIHHMIKINALSKSQNLPPPPIKQTITSTLIDDTPVKGKCRTSILTHEITKMRPSRPVSPLHMSLDCSVDENPLDLEDKKVDFTTVDLKFLTDNVSQFDSTNNVTKAVSDSSTSFKRVDSGFNENTFYTNASSYYESAIKPSELTITSGSKGSGSTALKEISNVNWMRVDSGFKDENSADNVQFYVTENSIKGTTSFAYTEAKIEEKENDFDKYFLQSSAKNDAMSMSDIFPDEMTCNFTSTPSKNKTRKF